jgi:hypothetical protein
VSDELGLWLWLLVGVLGCTSLGLAALVIEENLHPHPEDFSKDRRCWWRLW